MACCPPRPLLRAPKTKTPMRTLRGRRNVQRLGQAPSIPLTLPRANTKQGDGQTYRDLASHYWAGLPAAVTLEARDQAEQTGHSEPYKLVLPERKFDKPLARALIEQRKRLVDRPDLRAKVARALDALTIAPELFIRNTQVYLGIRTAFRRLKNNNDIAVHGKHGGSALAGGGSCRGWRPLGRRAAVRTAQEELMKALERDASEEEIKRLMDELRTALNEFLENMKQQAQKNPNFTPENRSRQNRVITSQDLERMLKKIEDLAKTGSKDAARQMLSELRDLLENAQPGNQASNSQSQEMMQMLDGLSELISKQQQLLDETYRAQQQSEYGSPGDDGEPGSESREGREGKQGRQGQGQQGKNGQGKSGQGKNGENPFPGLGQQQGGLQKQLKELMDRLKGFGAKPPEQFDGAGQAMGKAGDALGQENAGRATEQQTLALDKMRQGAKSLVEQMMSGMGQPGNQGRAQAGGRRSRSAGTSVADARARQWRFGQSARRERHPARPADIGRAAPAPGRARPPARRTGLYRAADRALLTLLFWEPAPPRWLLARLRAPDARSTLRAAASTTSVAVSRGRKRAL